MKTTPITLTGDVAGYDGEYYTDQRYRMLVSESGCLFQSDPLAQRGINCRVYSGHSKVVLDRGNFYPDAASRARLAQRGVKAI